ncbi:hypothetical protein GCK32_009764 [Trichostrongylus colubriformis]|uniref:Uncharacterized protein n=1 Tax=Trichostrongylus colubriformis TaxID=6319 RepID=A0AAN8INE7_TRICO
MLYLTFDRHYVNNQRQTEQKERVLKLWTIERVLKLWTIKRLSNSGPIVRENTKLKQKEYLVLGSKVVNSENLCSSYCSNNCGTADMETSKEETINRPVMSKTIRIINIPNHEKLSVREILRGFLEKMVKYDVTGDANPLSWGKTAGTNDDGITIKAEMSNSFREHFLERGKHNLLDYNQQNNAKIRVIRCQTMQVSDLENLSLFLRRMIREHCKERNIDTPEMSVRNAYITLKNDRGDTKRFNSTELAVALGWSLKEWHGTPILKLMTATELKAMESGRLKWRSFNLDAFTNSSALGGLEHNEKCHSCNEERNPKRKSEVYEKNVKDVGESTSKLLWT